VQKDIGAKYYYFERLYYFINKRSGNNAYRVMPIMPATSVDGKLG